MASKRKNLTALKLTSAIVALAALPVAVNAAECFDEESSNPKAGNATAVVGPDVGLMQGGGDYERPSAGDDVFSEDYVRTGEASHMQLKLCDWSTYTFPPESEAQINEFYDDEGARSRRVVNYVRGGFRYASGRDTEPGSTEVEIQESGVTMGVRGTNVILVELAGAIYALLEGPALDNTGYTPKGRVEFWTGENRDVIQARLIRPGWVVRIGPDGVSDPYRADEALLRRIYGAFLPAVPDEDEAFFAYENNPSGASGQGAQEGQEGVDTAINQNRRKDEDTENLPEQPSEAGISFEERYNEAFPDETPPPPPPFPVAVGDILPLDALDYYADAQASPSGHIFAIAPAQLFVDNGSGPTLADDGVVIVQINFDIASRMIAPEALASFVKFDFSLLDPSNLGLDDVDAALDDQFTNAFVQALISSSNIPFDSGEGGVAVFPAQAFTVTVRQGVGETVTVDVTVDFSSTNGQMVTSNAITEALDLQLMPGDGDLAYFNFGLSEVFTIADLTGHSTSGTTKLYGFTPHISQTLGQVGPLTGLAYVQIEVNFNNRTIGGPGSFMVVTAAAGSETGGQQANAYVSLDQPAPFSAGLYNMALYPLSLLTNNGSAIAGQALVADGSDVPVYADIAAILEANTGAHLYSEILLETPFYGADYEPASIAELDALGVALGTGALFFDGSIANQNAAALSNAATGDFFGSMNAKIDVSFANRTIGGGDSFVSANLFNNLTSSTFQFSEFLNAASFDSALGGSGVFAFDGADFSGNNIQSMIFIIRNDLAGGAATSADAFLNFTDGAGGKGLGELRGMTLTPGVACPGACD